MTQESGSMMLKFEKVCEILERYECDKSKLIPILQAVQEEYRYLPEEVMTYVATSLNIPPAQVYGVATFILTLLLSLKANMSSRSVMERLVTLKSLSLSLKL